jgi:hypothetical protein
MEHGHSALPWCAGSYKTNRFSSDAETIEKAILYYFTIAHLATGAELRNEADIQGFPIFPNEACDLIHFLDAGALERKGEFIHHYTPWQPLSRLYPSS